jgi:phthiodiolone/phenolphthiodiolone dimycocerosates ketoreductase
MKVGLLVTPMHPMASIQTMVAVAEDAKADSVWLPDHLLGCAHPALWPDMAMASVGFRRGR